MKKLILLTTMALALTVRADPPWHLTAVLTNANGITYNLAALPPAATNYMTSNGAAYYPDTYLFLHASPADSAWTAFTPVPVPGASIGTTNPITSERFIQAWNSTQYLSVQSSNRVLGVASDYYPAITNVVGAPPPQFALSWPGWLWLYRF